MTARLALLVFGCALAASVVAATPAARSDAAPVDAIGDSAQWQADIAAFEAQDRAQPPAAGGVVFVGSSSIRLWDSLAADFPDVGVLNRGFGGSRVRDATAFADRIVLPYRPRAVLLYAGDNDLAEGRTPAQVRDDVAAFVRAVHAKQPGTRIAFIAIKPSPARAALLPQAREANALVRALAAREPRLDYIDVFTPMLDADGAPRAELFLADRLHMNRAGYALWRKVVGSWVEEHAR